MSDHALPLTRLIEQFASLPGIGMKTAQRLAFHVLTLSKDEVEQFSKTLLDSARKIHHCEICQNYTDQPVCSICADPNRMHPSSAWWNIRRMWQRLKRTREYRGRYHVLHGLIFPDGRHRSPTSFASKNSWPRLQDGNGAGSGACHQPDGGRRGDRHVSVALLKPLGVRVSRLAFGIPVGSSLEYADEMTLYKALENRSPL